MRNGLSLVEHHGLPTTVAFPLAQADKLQPQCTEPNTRLPALAVRFGFFPFVLVQAFLQTKPEFQRMHNAGQFKQAEAAEPIIGVEVAQPFGGELIAILNKAQQRELMGCLSKDWP